MSSCPTFVFAFPSWVHLSDRQNSKSPVALSVSTNKRPEINQAFTWDPLSFLFFFFCFTSREQRTSHRTPRCSYVETSCVIWWKMETHQLFLYFSEEWGSNTSRVRSPIHTGAHPGSALSVLWAVCSLKDAARPRFWHQNFQIDFNSRAQSGAVTDERQHVIRKSV